MMINRFIAPVRVVLALLSILDTFKCCCIAASDDHDASTASHVKLRGVRNVAPANRDVFNTGDSDTDTSTDMNNFQTKRRGELTKENHHQSWDYPHKSSLRAHVLPVDELVWRRSYLSNGPGSYYTGDYNITIIDRTRNNYGDVIEWVKEFNENNKDNPIVMWNIENLELWAFRERFMYQNLDADTGSTPLDYAMVGMVDSNYEGAIPVRVCTDHQWRDLTGYNSWVNVQYANIGIGPTAGHVITERSVTNERDARGWVLQQHGKDDNPIVMWEVRDNVLKYLREDVMYRNLNADTGKSPLHYVTSTKDFLSSRGESFTVGRTVRVRNDDWWADLKSWEIVDGGDIGIGIGSYFLGDNDVHISKVDGNFENEAEARAWVIGQYNEPNPILMWQMKDGELWYHREKFMDEILSREHGGAVWDTPSEYVLHTKDYLVSRGEEGGKVHVRNNVWWNELISTDSPTASPNTSSPTPSPNMSSPSSSPTTTGPSSSTSSLNTVIVGATAGVIVVAAIAVSIYLCKKHSCGPFLSGGSNYLSGKGGKSSVHEPPIPSAPTAQDPLIATEVGNSGVSPVVTAELVTRATALKKKHDIFFTHNWGNDEEGRDNHKRVVLLNKEFKKRKIGSTWFDEERMHGNIVDRMARGIDDSLVVVVCLTKKYITKVAGLGENGDNDNCKFEFEYALRRKGVENLIVVVMEEECKSPKDWNGPVGVALGSHLYHTFFKDQDLKNCVDKLAEEIRRRKEISSRNL